MTPFLLYQLKAGLCIMLFTGLYYLLFRKDTFHRFNRIYLLGSLVLSVIIPAIHFTPITVGNDSTIPNLIQEVTVYAGQTSPAAFPVHQTIPVFRQAYLAICLLLSVYLFYQLVVLGSLIIRRGFTAFGGYRLVVLPENKLSFSFFNLIFLNANETRDGADNPVLQHEMAHARQAHSLDIMLIQIVKIFQWFNPFIYLMEKALKETHEYLADEAVLEQNGEPDRYRMLLLTQVFGVQPGIFSFFNYSLIKKRLIMMTKEKSPLRNRLKYLAVLPLVIGIGLMMCCRYTYAQEPPKPKKAETPQPQTIEIVAGNEEETAVTDEDPVFIMVEEPALFQGGNLENFREWVQKNVAYPPIAVQNGIFGKVMVQFAINSKGKVCDVKILRGVDPSLDKEAIRVLSASPDWTPAKQGGKIVKQQFVMPIVFALGAEEKPDISGKPVTDSAFVKVDEQAIFQGGHLEKFREWVQQNLIYPPEAAKKGIGGEVYITFSLDAQGKVYGVKVLKSVESSLDKEVIRVVSSSPDWIPAKQRGKNVKQQFVMPVVFALQ